MNYTELLNTIIKESKLRNIDIIEKLKEKGTPITTNYLSVLKNDSTKVASEEVSTNIAEICGYEYPKALAIQGYLDKAPMEVIEFITFIMDNVKESTKKVAELLPKEQADKLLHELDEMTMAWFICDMLEHKEEYDVKNVFNMQSLGMRKEPQRYAVIPLAEGGEIKIVNKNELINND